MRFSGWLVAAAAPFAVAAVGCSTTVTNDPAPAPTTVQGTLTVDWTINGTTDPNQCNQSTVTSIEIGVTRTDGTPAGTFRQVCSDFATSITLDQGSYTAIATLIDANATSRTTTIAINPFTLHGNDELKIPIDFPASSFE